MAIDTAEKRRSAAGVPFLPLGPGVTPNASKDAEWRQQAAWGYSGIPLVVVLPFAISVALAPELAIGAALAPELSLAGALASELRIAGTAAPELSLAGASVPELNIAASVTPED